MRGFRRAMLELCVCLCSVNREKKQQFFTRSKATLQGLPPQGLSMPAGAEAAPRARRAAPSVATRGCSRATQSGGPSTLSARNAEQAQNTGCFHRATATHRRDCSRECLCAPSPFQMDCQRVVASLSSALNT